MVSSLIITWFLLVTQSASMDPKGSVIKRLTCKTVKAVEILIQCLLGINGKYCSSLNIFITGTTGYSIC